VIEEMKEGVTVAEEGILKETEEVVVEETW
jgi:hypothetical protein